MSNRLAVSLAGCILIMSACASPPEQEARIESPVFIDRGQEHVVSNDVLLYCNQVSSLYADMAYYRTRYSQAIECPGDLFYQHLLVSELIPSVTGSIEDKLRRTFADVACALPPLDDFDSYRYMVGECVEIMQNAQ